MEIHQSEKKGGDFCFSEHNLKNTWVNIKKVNICVTGVLEEEENDNGAGKKLFKETMTDKILNLAKP